MRRVIARRNRRREESGNVGVPVRHAAGGEIQPGGNRTLQHIPRGYNVARPEDRAVALCSQVRRASQDHYPAAVSEVAAKTLVYRSGVEQRIYIVITRS